MAIERNILISILTVCESLPVTKAALTVLLSRDVTRSRAWGSVAYRHAALIEHMMDALSSVFHEQKNCSLVIRVTPMMYKQNPADSRMWDSGEGTCREMRNIRVIVLDNISAYMSSNSLTNSYCKSGFTDMRPSLGRRRSHANRTLNLAGVWYQQLLSLWHVSKFNTSSRQIL